MDVLCRVCEKRPPTAGADFCEPCRKEIGHGGRARVTVECACCTEKLHTWADNLGRACICGRCQSEHELPAFMPAPNPPARPCDCGGTRFVRAIARETVTTPYRAALRPGQVRLRAQTIAGVPLEERVCVTCARVTRHALGEVPAGSAHGTEALQVGEGEGPFR